LVKRLKNEIAVKNLKCELGVSLLFVLAPDIQQTISQLNRNHSTNPFFYIA
jgi:hypothetical protein